MTKQLRINFETNETVRRNLRDGRFSVFVEYAPPAADQPFKMAMKPGVELARYVAEDERVAALAITHRYGDRQEHDLLKVVEELRQHCDKEFVVYLCGRGLKPVELHGLVAGLRSHGVNTVVPVSGVGGQDHPRTKKGKPLCAPSGYLDSCRQLALIAQDNPDLYRGAVVNPFKYNIADVYLQYAKMVRKLNLGAGFVVAQAGWDMRKYQELQWYLQSRGIDEPFLARMMLVRPDQVSRIVEHRAGGMVMSREFGALLQRESQVSEAQALSAQIRRLSLLGAGSRLLGYSGVQLGGSTDPKTIRTILDRLFETLEELPEYPDWVDAWEDFHNRIETAPYPYRYYAFRHLLSKEHQTFDEAACSHTSFMIPPPSLLDKLRYQVGKRLHLDRSQAGWTVPLKMLVSQASGHGDWHLDRTFLLAASQCPKGLEEGACGGSRPDGTCEFGGKRCFYHRVLSLAHWQNDLRRLEGDDEDQ